VVLGIMAWNSFSGHLVRISDSTQELTNGLTAIRRRLKRLEAELGGVKRPQSAPKQRRVVGHMHLEPRATRSYGYTYFDLAWHPARNPFTEMYEDHPCWKISDTDGRLLKTISIDAEAVDRQIELDHEAQETRLKEYNEGIVMGLTPQAVAALEQSNAEHENTKAEAPKAQGRGAGEGGGIDMVLAP
jgi:hypothetical protein